MLSPRGCLLFGADEQRAALEREQQLAAASRQTLRVLSPAQILALVPVLKPAAVGWGIHEPLAMDMDVEALLQGFLRSARRHGLRVLTGQEVLSVRRQGARWHVRTSQLEIRAEVLVNAAGAWADRIAGLAGIAPLGLIPCRRTAFTFDAPAGMDVRSWPMVMDAEERFYFKPDAGRMLGSLAEEVPSEPCDAQADDLDVAIAVDRIESAWTQPITRVVRAWAGLRTFSSDRNPVSGFEPPAPGSIGMPPLAAMAFRPPRPSALWQPRTSAARNGRTCPKPTSSRPRSSRPTGFAEPAYKKRGGSLRCRLYVDDAMIRTTRLPWRSRSHHRCRRARTAGTWSRRSCRHRQSCCRARAASRSRSAGSG